MGNGSAEFGSGYRDLGSAVAAAGEIVALVTEEAYGDVYV